MKHIFTVQLAALGGLVLALSGCGEESLVSDTDEVSMLTNALTTGNAGSDYAQQCMNAGVPLPPAWQTTTVGPTNLWRENLVPGDPEMSPTFGDSFASVGLGGHVYYYQPPSGGMCVLLQHLPGPFDVICQSTNGKACFWEILNGPTTPPPINPLVIAALSGYGPAVVPGGADLVTNDRCTRCHAGENVFLGHLKAKHPLNLIGKVGWMPNTYQDPIVPLGYPQAGPSTVNYPASCMTSACHASGGAAGRFPLLETSQFKNKYCHILEQVTSLPASEGGMPPNSACTSLGSPDCPRHTDPAVRAMLAACAAPNPPVPTSLSGLSPPGIGSLATRRHVSSSAPGLHSHSFTNATTTLPNAGCCTGQTTHAALKPTDKIEVSIYMPADDKPREVMLQLFSPSAGDWRRVFWGEDLIASSPRTNKGALQSAGSWQVLSFTPADLGFTTPVVFNGMKFTLYGGTASWANVLFRNSDSPLNNQFVSQVWVGDRLPAGAVPATEGGDLWDWKPDNMALFGGSAYMSSVYGNGPERGNDGNTDGNYFNGSVFHTKNIVDSTPLGMGTGGEWWYVDLLRVRTVRRVVLYNRTDGSQERLSHFRIAYVDPVLGWRMASDQSNTITSAANPVIPIDFPAVNTQYVMVQKTDNNYLHLAEVEVYGDP